ncbi:hypothetical protein [Lentzea tibetensis]|nr:hypothetical protein [Lentzea tibetensis]
MFSSTREAMSWFRIVRPDVLAAQHIADEHHWDDLTLGFAGAL